MSLITPPTLPPRVALDDDDGLQRLRLRLFQIWATTATIGVTAWLCSLGALPAILSLVVAKHVLVAILVMGLKVNASRESFTT